MVIKEQGGVIVVIKEVEVMMKGGLVINKVKIKKQIIINYPLHSRFSSISICFAKSSTIYSYII